MLANEYAVEHVKQLFAVPKKNLSIGLLKRTLLFCSVCGLKRNPHRVASSPTSGHPEISLPYAHSDPIIADFSVLKSR